MKFTTERHDKDGAEILDPRPMQPPLGYKRAPSLAEQIRQQVIASKLDELANLAETEEEADDFEIDDELGPYSPHENDGMPTIKELKVHVEKINAEIKRQNLEKLRKELEARAAPAGGGRPISSSEDPKATDVLSSGPA